MATVLLMGFGLAAPSGLNAYLPLLILALADRISGGDQLSASYDFLSSIVGIVVLLALLTVELIADKIPGVDRINDLVQSAVRPAAGGLAMMAVTADSDVNPVLALILGLLAAGIVHVAKVGSRQRLVRLLGPIGSPFISMTFDFLAAITATLALLLPVTVPLLLLPYVVLVIVAVRHFRGPAARPESSATGSSP